MLFGIHGDVGVFYIFAFFVVRIKICSFLVCFLKRMSGVRISIDRSCFVFSF